MSGPKSLFTALLGDVRNAIVGLAVSSGAVVYAAVSHFIGDIPWALSIPAALLTLCCILFLYEKYGRHVPGLTQVTTVAANKEATVDPSPFALWLRGDIRYIEIDLETGPQGKFRVLKFDLINAGRVQAEDVEVNVSGTSYHHADLLPLPYTFERIALTSRNQGRAINPGQQAEFVLMSLEDGDASVPFWGDHKFVAPSERRYTKVLKDPVREGQHLAEIRVSSKNVPPKLFKVHIIVAGSSPTILPIDGDRLVHRGR